MHFSTDYVFDGQTSDGYLESATPRPINAYGRSKLLGEQAILKSQAKAAIIRTSWLFGADGPNFILTILKLAHERPELTVVNDQWGCPTYAKDLAKAVLDAFRLCLIKR